MKTKYTVTYKVAPIGAKYIYQKDKGDNKAGDIVSSSGGHMWYVLNDGSGLETSYGFESMHGELFGEGMISINDNAAYQQTSYEVTLALTPVQYKQLIDFSENPQSKGFDDKKYRVNYNSCVDFVYHSLGTIGYNKTNFEGNLFPNNNPVILKSILSSQSASIVRDNLIRNGDQYEKKEVKDSWVTPKWLKSIDKIGTLPTPPPSLINIDINPSPKPQKQIQNENKAHQDVERGYIQNTPTHKISVEDDLLSKTDFTSTQMASFATGGIRPGAMQLDTNIRPSIYLSQYYLTPDGQPDFNWRNAVTFNNLSAMTIFNTYVDPLLLDLSGQGVGMTDIHDGVLFDIDHSGTLKRSGWVDRQTGILVVDNGSGQIKNASQMFSEYYGGKFGVNGASGERKFTDSFDALNSEDSNHDGVINKHDPIWHKLRVWVDATHDAKVNERELKTLAELGITQINIASAKTNEVRNGNQLIARGSFIINGESRTMLAVDFFGDLVSNTLNIHGEGGRVTSSINGITTTAYASQSKQNETLDADKLGVNNLYGGSGNDTLIAAKAGSWLVGGGGSNTYIGSEGNDVFVISADDDPKNIYGNGGYDTAIIVGEKGVILDMSHAGLTIAEGGSGNDAIRSGGTHSVFIKGGSGDSTLIGGMGNDVLVGGSGRNTIIGGSGKSVIYAGSQGDIIYASKGGSIIYAGGGEDEIFGSVGNDIIEVGHGNALIDGDGGTNIVNLHGNHGDYRITRTNSGYEVADKVIGRDGTVKLKNIQKLNFSDISAVDLQIPNAMPVEDVLTRDKNGQFISRTQTHLIAAKALLANDQRLNSQGDLRLSNVGDAVGGKLSLTAEGDISFTPDSTYTGLISFKYGVIDAANNPSASVVDLDSGKTAPMRAVVTLLTPEVPLDPLAAQQWYLSDAHILPVWQDYTGKGVRIGQFEPGGDFATSPEIFDINHPDLAVNVDNAWQQSQQNNRVLPDKVSNHATMVAGVMVAARNNIGGVGVAYNATLGGYYLANDGDDLAGLGHMVNFDVANNSWGFVHDFALSNFQDGSINSAASLSLNAQYAAANGRGGLGTVIVTAGGNDRASGGNAQGSLTNNNRFSVQVGAINAQSDLSTLQIDSSPFSNPGASLLVSAPGSNVVSTSHMLETERGSTFGNDYTSMQGTSFATPIVSGIVALMLEANPNLGYRDVQQILALSARKVNDESTEWNDNNGSRWNGGGMHISHDYGFGAVDARSAVRLAESWMSQNTADNEYVYSATSGVLGKNIAAGETLTSSIEMKSGLNIEHIEIDFDAEVSSLGDLTLKLISPDGTESILLNRQGKIPDGMLGANVADRGSRQSGAFRYSFMSTHHLGENSEGHWTLQMSSATSSFPASLKSWSLRLYGSKSSADDSYFYTDEYVQLVHGQAERAMLDDVSNGRKGGRNTFNAAAVSKNISVNLLTGDANIGGSKLSIKNSHSMQNIVTGDGDDMLVAGRMDALLNGGRGNNTLTGGFGKDFFVINHRSVGSDIINDFEASRGEVINLVGFGKKTFADLRLIQQGADVKIELGNEQVAILKKQSVIGISANNFSFQDTFIAPAVYISSDSSTHQLQTGLGIVVLEGGSTGVSLTSDAQGIMKFSLSGKIYSRDSASSDSFVIKAQPGVNNYRNALRGFRHGIDKIDLRQVGVTDFSQLSIVKINRGTINGLSQINGVNVIFNGSKHTESDVNLLYIDTLYVSQVDANDFIFAETVPDRVSVATTLPDDKLIITEANNPQNYLQGSNIPKLEPIRLPELRPIIIPQTPNVLRPIFIPKAESFPQPTDISARHLELVRKPRCIPSAEQPSLTDIPKIDFAVNTILGSIDSSTNGYLQLIDRDIEHLAQVMAVFEQPMVTTTMMSNIKQYKLEPVLLVNR